LPNYIFTIRSGERQREPRRVVPLVDDEAALGYACDMVSELRKSAGYDDPTLTVRVGDDYRPIVYSIPFLAGCA
jgi:hypothetical protein